MTRTIVHDMVCLIEGSNYYEIIQGIIAINQATGLPRFTQALIPQKYFNTLLHLWLPGGRTFFQFLQDEGLVISMIEGSMPFTIAIVSFTETE